MNERELIDFITAKRWFGAKTREVTHASVVDEAPVPTADETCAIALVEVRFAEGTHELYQLFRCGDGYGALDDPKFCRELLHLVRSGSTVQAGEGAIGFHRVEGFAALDEELGGARALGAEQTNTSIVYGDEVIMKAYRRIEAGINPELELLRFLTEREFANVAALGGWYSYVGKPLDATLGVVQQFVPGGVDGWELALDELATEPDRFLGRLRRLGEVTGAMHTVLGSDASDPNFCPEHPSVESLGLLTATVDEEIERVFSSLPEDLDAVAPIAGRGEDVREQLRALTHVAATGRVIRHHGDFHLGQTLWADDWVILDFEGEPARTLPERRRKRSPLRDVAGMLRSFAYAVSAVEIVRGVAPASTWEDDARHEFLEGYLATVEPTLLPSGRGAVEKLLTVFELEKAVYELRYELNTRPEWVAIPVAGIGRLLEERVEA